MATRLVHHEFHLVIYNEVVFGASLYINRKIVILLIVVRLLTFLTAYRRTRLCREQCCTPGYYSIAYARYTGGGGVSFAAYLFS